MTEVKFTPKAFKEVDKDGKETGVDLFTGHIMVNPPKTRERMLYLKECHFKFNEDGTLDKDDAGNSLEAISKAIGLAEKHIVSIDIKAKDGTEYKSLDALERDNRCDKIVQELAMQILGGFSLSKN